MCFCNFWDKYDRITTTKNINNWTWSKLKPTNLKLTFPNKWQHLNFDNYKSPFPLCHALSPVLKPCCHKLPCPLPLFAWRRLWMTPYFSFSLELSVSLCFFLSLSLSPPSSIMFCCSTSWSNFKAYRSTLSKHPKIENLNNFLFCQIVLNIRVWDKCLPSIPFNLSK